MKKSLLFSLLGVFALFAFGFQAQAASPSLSLTSTDDGQVQLTVNSGAANSNVLMYYSKSDSGTHLDYIGSTNSSGYFSATLNPSTYDVLPESAVYVRVGSDNSNQVNWPISTTTGSGALYLSQSGVVMQVGNSLNLTLYNAGSEHVYLLNNSNPQIANVNINSNSQINLRAIAYGQTVATICSLGSSSNCASVYVTVQNSGAQALLFSQSRLTIAYNQTASVSVLNSGSNTYTIVNNSNPSVISATLSGSTINLSAGSTSGSASLTVCTTDMSSCGIVVATSGNDTSTSLTFNNSSPTVNIGQVVTVSVSGGSDYNISSISDSNILGATISGSVLSLTGKSAGSATVTVCASNGNCASLTANVGYSSTGGALTLSQNNLWLQAGQAVSVVVSGGSTPYSIAPGSSSSYFSYNLNNNILTLTGVAAGSGSLSVCSAGGACVNLSVLVNGTATNAQLNFSNNNLDMTVGQEAKVNLFGSGGYYVSSSNNQNVATISVSGSVATIKALTAGSANAKICQSDGQCSTLYAAVKATTNTTPPAFSINNPKITVDQSLDVTLSNGSSYYISSNSNPTIVSASISGNKLTIKSLAAGSSVLSVCSAVNNCSALAVTVIETSQASQGEGNSGSSSNNGGTDLIAAIGLEANYLAAGNADIIAGNAKTSRKTSEEGSNFNKYIQPLVDKSPVSVKAADALNYFVLYGTPSTLKLGAGERAGVLSSYYQAYDKLPQTAAQWSDALKIASGRWPGETSDSAVAQAKLEFAKVYNRAPDMNNAHDANAITIIAYGLRPTNRNMDSEKAAINSFRHVYNHYPVNPLAWNIVRAIAYSGASK